MSDADGHGPELFLPFLKQRFNLFDLSGHGVVGRRAVHIARFDQSRLGGREAD